MDKVSVNQQIILMRNVVKSARRYQYLQLRNSALCLEKKIKEIRDEKLKKSLDNKLRRVKEGLERIKFISLDIVSKEALKATEPWQNILNDPKTSREQKLIARIANSAMVQKRVQQFREENKDWELYMNTLLELWDEKKRIKQNISTEENKNDRNESNQTMERFKSKTKNSESPSKPMKDEVNGAKSTKGKRIIKPTNKEKSSNPILTNETTMVEREENESFEKNSNNEEEEVMESNDDFFINKKSLFPNVVESRNQDESESVKRNFKLKSKNPKNQNNNDPRKSWKKRKDDKNENVTIHPSWQAKKQQKSLFKIDVNNTQAKKIRFTD